MVELKSMPLGAAAEVLQFIGENEGLTSFEALLGDRIPSSEVRIMLAELAMELRKMAAAAKPDYNPKTCRSLNSQTKQAIEYLSPLEEKSLLKAFGLIEQR